MQEAPKSAGSLRHYLLNHRRIGSRLKARVVLAETANKLYRDTSYQDLISFEEDIARISALVLVIAESAGSLAELGAFSSIQTIRENMAAVIRTEHASAESFVRYGPVERLKNKDENRIGVFPWRVTTSGAVIKNSIKSHCGNITQFINSLLQRSPNRHLFRKDPSSESFWIILWILHLSHSIAISDLTEYANKFTDIAQKDVRNRLFCMQLAGWVDCYTYINKTYWYSLGSADPFPQYRFIADVAVRDPLRRKAEVAQSLQTALKVPKHVRDHVADKKAASS